MAGMWKDLTAQTPEMKDMGAAGREPRHVGAYISWTRPPALGKGSHPNLVSLESVDPSFLEMSLSPPSSFPCGCCGENKCFCAFTELKFGSSCNWS